MIDYTDFILRTNLTLLRPIGNKYNAQCPLCDDSSVRKHRLWFLQLNDGNYAVKCHNSGCLLEKSTNLLGFLKVYDSRLYDELNNLEKKKYYELFFKNKDNKKFERKSYKNTIIDDSDSEIKFISIDKLNKNIFLPIVENKKAVDYVTNRKVPEDIYKHWYYVPRKFSNKYDFAGNIVMPFIRFSDNKICGFSSRSIFEKSFIINLFSESAYKVYNLYNVDTTKPVYIFESIFDSLFIDNSVACCGASFPDELLDKFTNPVFCFDFDKTGLNKSIQYLHNNYDVFIIPKKYQSKAGQKVDLNEIVTKYNLTKNDVEKMILTNIYTKYDIVNVLSMLRNNRWSLDENTKTILKSKG